MINTAVILTIGTGITLDKSAHKGKLKDEVGQEEDREVACTFWRIFIQPRAKLSSLRVANRNVIDSRVMHKCEHINRDFIYDLKTYIFFIAIILYKSEM